MFGYSRFADIVRVHGHRPPPAHPPLAHDTQLYVYGDPAYQPGFGVMGPYKRYPGRPSRPLPPERAPDHPHWQQPQVRTPASNPSDQDSPPWILPS
jgi:hypothetical protein